MSEEVETYHNVEKIRCVRDKEKDNIMRCYIHRTNDVQLTPQIDDVSLIYLNEAKKTHKRVKEWEFEPHYKWECEVSDSILNPNFKDITCYPPYLTKIKKGRRKIQQKYIKRDVKKDFEKMSAEEKINFRRNAGLSMDNYDTKLLNLIDKWMIDNNISLRE